MTREEAVNLYEWAYGSKECVFLETSSVPHFYMNGKCVTLARVFLSIKLGRELFSGHCACHHCDMPRCINPDHLFEGTYKENTADAREKGRLNWKPKPRPRKLNSEQIQEIRRLYFEEGLRQVAIAKRFNVGQPLICQTLKK